MPHVRFEEKIRHEAACWIWTGAKNGDGQGSMTVGSRQDGSRKKVNVRRWAYQFFIAPIPVGLIAYTKCLKKLCVNPDHIVIGTPSDFLRYRRKRGKYEPVTFRDRPLTMYGEMNPQAKLSDAECNEIRAEKGKTKALLLARRHNVSEPTIYGIWSGASRSKRTPDPSDRFASSKGLTIPGTTAPPIRIQEAGNPHQGEKKCSTPSSSSS